MLRVSICTNLGPVSDIETIKLMFPSSVGHEQNLPSILNPFPLNTNYYCSIYFTATNWRVRSHQLSFRCMHHQSTLWSTTLMFWIFENGPHLYALKSQAHCTTMEAVHCIFLTSKIKCNVVNTLLHILAFKRNILMIHSQTLWGSKRNRGCPCIKITYNN